MLEYLSHDITINDVYNVPILLFGDFNSRTTKLINLEK